MAVLRLGTRGSPLALWQAHHVRQLLTQASGHAVELVIIETHGDRDQKNRLAQMGGFGVFTRAIQEALLEGQCDIAVHSLKDLPTLPVEGLSLAGVPARGVTADAFLSTRHANFAALPPGAVVGTSSLRRRAQILRRRPDLQLIDLRGNIDTRLRKLAEQNLDAIVLACAGLERLGLAERITERLDPSWMLPAVGQGAIGLECRDADAVSREVVGKITHVPTMQAVTTEREMLFALGGGCLVPIGAATEHRGETLHLRGAVLAPDGTRWVEGELHGPAREPLELGRKLAAQLNDRGAGEILKLA